MKHSRTASLVALAVVVAAVASAGDFDVPQGGGKLPIIALVECLAEEGSRTEGQYCRTTYQCMPQRDGTEVSGTLWEGLTYHDGRRVTLESDDISVERSCVLTVDDDAKVSYFTGYRPDGKVGDVVAFTRAGSATVTLTLGSTTIPADNMLGQFLSHAAVRADTLEDWINRSEGGNYCHGRTSCRTGGMYIEGIAATDKTACYVNARIVETESYPGLWLGYIVDDWDAQDPGGRNDSVRGPIECPE